MAEEIEKVEKAEEVIAQDIQNLSEDMLDEVSGGKISTSDEKIVTNRHFHVPKGLRGG